MPSEYDPVIIDTIENGKKVRIYKSKEYNEYPDVDILTLLFEHSAVTDDNAPLHVEAADPSNLLTKGTARTVTKQIAAALRKNYGIGAKGKNSDIVVSMSSGQILLPAFFYGVIAAGGVYSAASSSFTVDELARQITQGGGTVVACSAECEQVTIEAAAKCGLGSERVLILISDKGQWALKRSSDGKNLLTKDELDWDRITDRKELEDSLACLLYSSGTTGVPKGVRLSHSMLVAEAAIPGVSAKRMFEKLAPSERWPYSTLAHLPAAHIAGVQGYLINPFYMGGPVYWMPKFDFQKFCDYNKKFGITFFFTVPPIYLLIAKSPIVTDHFDTLRIAISGAAPLGADLQNAASARLGAGKCFISQTWGLSETTGSVTGQAWDDYSRDTTGSVSPLLPNISVRLVDDDNNDVEDGKPGEVLVKGPMVTQGYFNNDQATKDSFIDGWFCTGDIAEIRDGKFYIVDRKKELIKYKGLQVAPAELEALLISHDLILDAAVIGVDSEATEVPRAYVVTAQDANGKSKISEDEIKEFVKKNVAPYKQLRGGVRFLEAIPKSASGKILRKDLRVEAKKEIPKAKL